MAIYTWRPTAINVNPVLLTTVKFELLFNSSPKLAPIMYIKYYFEWAGDQNRVKLPETHTQPRPQEC